MPSLKLLQWKNVTYIHRRNHKCGWCWHIRDFPEAGRSSLDTWFYMQAAGIWFPATVFHGRRSHQGINSWLLVEIHHTQTVARGQCTGHEHRLKKEIKKVGSSNGISKNQNKLFREALKTVALFVLKFWSQRTNVSLNAQNRKESTRIAFLKQWI